MIQYHTTYYPFIHFTQARAVGDMAAAVASVSSLCGGERGVDGFVSSSEDVVYIAARSSVRSSVVD